MTRLKELQYIVDKTQKWSIDRLLHKNATLFSQNIKLQSELGELANAIEKGDYLEQMDGIGDCLVVAIVMGTVTQNDMFKNEVLNVMQYFDEDLKLEEPIHSHIAFNLFVKALNRYKDANIDMVNTDSVRTNSISRILADVFYSAHTLANSLGFDILRCLRMAYSTIHFRTGNIVNGVYVKDKVNNVIVAPSDELGQHIDVLIRHIVKVGHTTYKGQPFKLEYGKYTTDELMNEG